MTDQELLDMASTFDVKAGGSDLFPVVVERCRRADGPPRWAIRQKGFCLNKKGKWEYEPLPSSRTEAFFKRCRWDDRDEAIRVVKACEP